MALKTNSNENLKYLRLKEGKFYVGKDLEKGYTEVEGTITKMGFRDEEYEGTPLRKFIITLADEDETYQLNLNVETNAYSSIVSFLANADVSKPVTLVAKENTTTNAKTGKEGKRQSILVVQNGKYMKSYFTKEHTHGLPEWKIVTIGSGKAAKTVIDKSAYLEFLEGFINETLIPNIGNDVAAKQSPPAAKEEENDDMPDWLK